MKKILLLTILVLSLFIINSCHEGYRDGDRDRGDRHEERHEEHHVEVSW
jgi:hypothetical protein